MNNEPVAYAMFKDDEFYDAIHPKQYTEHIGSYTIPLYTHSAKTLTDFEIKGVLGLDECWIGEDCSIPDMIAFARAILRKAQEK